MNFFPFVSCDLPSRNIWVHSQSSNFFRQLPIDRLYCRVLVLDLLQFES